MTPTASPLVSVVTPVYNGEPYLRECIESVLAQTYPNWDYTIVNNCSQDRTREIADEYAARDPRIRVHNNNEFVSCEANHNIAVRQISPSSKYCKIVAADDWLYPECLSRMVEVAEAHPTVAIVCSYGLRDKGKGITCGGLPYSSTFLSGREICRASLLGGPYVFGQPSSVLYRADLVRSRKTFFNEANIHADTESCFELLQDHDFAFVHQILYFIRTREKSETALSKSLNTYLGMTLDFLKRYGPVFLTDRELADCIPRHLKRYYVFLAQSALGRPGPDFWTYHKTKLRELGYPLRYPRLAGLILIRLIDLLLNPKRTVEALLGRATARQI